METDCLQCSRHSVEAEKCTLGGRRLWDAGGEEGGVTGGLVVGKEVPDCSSSPLCTPVLSFVSKGGVSVWTAVVTLLS